MKLIKKLTIFTTALFLSTAVVFAQEDDFDSFDDYDSSDSEPALTIGGDASAGFRVYVDYRDDNGDTYKVKDWKSEANPSVKLNLGYSGASSAFNAKLKFDKNSLGDYKWDILDEFSASAFIGNFQFEAGKMRLVWGKTDKLHVLDNFNANDYTDYIIPDYIDRRISDLMFHAVYTTNSSVKIEAVYMPWMTPDRLGSGVWEPKAIGTLTDAIEPAVRGKLAAATTNKVTANQSLSVIQTLAAEYTASATLYNNDTSDNAAKAQMETSRSALIGALSKDDDPTIQSTKLTFLKDQVTAGTFDAYLNTTLDSLKDNVAVAETDFLETLMAASGFSSSDLYPDTHTLEYSQAGARITFTLGPVDLGFSYFYGYNKQPSVNKKMLASIKNSVTGAEMNPDYFAGDTSKITGGKLLHYDRMHIFGFEGAYVIPGIGLNTRWEFAYNMTEDMDGDDPTVLNNSLNWVFGFDRDLPLHNININIQTQGKYVLNGSKIDDMGAAKAFDVDYVQKNDDCDGLYTNNKLVLDITDTWNYEKIKLDVKAIWGIERGDLLIMPDLTFKLADSFALDFSGLIILCKDSYSEFDGWNHNSFAQISAKYSF